MTPTELDGRQVMVAARVHLEADAAATLRDANRRGAVMCACCGKDGKRKNLYVSESEANIVANERRMATGITMHVYRCMKLFLPTRNVPRLLIWAISIVYLQTIVV